jgi:hypothetical protein
MHLINHFQPEALVLAAQLSNNLNVKFNIARGYRAPSITELGNGSHKEPYDTNTAMLDETSMQEMLLNFSGIHYDTFL